MQELCVNPNLLRDVVKSRDEELANTSEVLVIEGTESVTEMNLRDRVIVNWSVVLMADASVILVADLDRGGVFAQVMGAMDLLALEERRRVIGNLLVTGLVYFLENGLKFS